ncbi:hypothetical protein [Cellvibrio sp. QJXJ]|uniref:hypothetical protein n=1 Tax=Cellvibrio sp. QJXJ TaxID=2964606 RepID=UPI0021C3869F|nr:hypothetical protein [Cellvibrio sp. QJXJ]UUA75141.1 hypothetical protein NNX04_22045 [Cellvibrio sp. QJXJ]
MAKANEFSEARKLVAWGLERSDAMVENCEYEGKRYEVTTKLFSGSFGKRAAKVINEIGANRKYLVNTETHILWIEHAARYKSEYGNIRLGEVVFKEIH